MIHTKIKYLLIPILLVILLTESCSSGSRGLFEKRKHLKGWHFQTQASINKTSSKSTAEKIAENDDEAQVIHLKKTHQNKLNSLKLQELNTLTNTIENKGLVGVFSSKKSSVKTPEKRLDKVKSGSKFIDKTTEFKAATTDKKVTNGWHFNGFYFFLLMLFPFAFQTKKPNKIQAWAARNKTKSRTLLVILKVLLAATSIALGVVLGVPFSLPLLLFSVVLFMVAIGTSEYWKNKNQMTNKKKLGLLGVVNTATSFGFFSFGGMLQNSFDLSQWSIMNGLLEVSANTPDHGFAYHPVHLVVIAIVLTALFGGLLAGIGFLSCTIYCSGYEFWGIALFVVGGSVVLVGYFYHIIKLFRKKVDTDERKRKRFKISLLLAGIGQVLIWLYMLVYEFN